MEVMELNLHIKMTIPNQISKLRSDVQSLEDFRLNLERNREKTRNISLAITKVQEAELWLKEEIEDVIKFNNIQK